MTEHLSRPPYKLYTRKTDRKALVLAVILSVAVILALWGICSKAMGAEITPPNNLYMGLIAEDTSGHYQTYLVIASVVRNRLNNGMNHGLVALKRKNLAGFVARETTYAKSKGKDLERLAGSAIAEVWQGKDYSGGACFYEHTGVYPIPYWAKNKQVVKVMYRGTKQELTLWR